MLEWIFPQLRVCSNELKIAMCVRVQASRRTTIVSSIYDNRNVIEEAEQTSTV